MAGANGGAEGFFSAEVHQATGMIAAQARCEVDEALDRLKIRADALGRPVHDTALLVIEGLLRFDE